MPEEQPAVTRFNVCFLVFVCLFVLVLVFGLGFFLFVWGFFGGEGILIMPVITLNLQLNTCLSVHELLIGSLKTEALNDMPVKCLICNYLLKCFSRVGAMRVRARSPISQGSRPHSHTVHFPSHFPPLLAVLGF